MKFKRDIANAAVDGVLPSGSLDSQQHSAEAALGALKDLTAAMAKSDIAAPATPERVPAGRPAA